MAEKNNAVCSICGKEYYTCMSCADTMKLHPWKTYTDTQECFKVFQVVRGFSTGVYTKEETKEKLQNVDLKDIDSFRPHIKKIIKEDILKEDILKEDEVVEKVENNVVIEDVVKVDEIDESTKTEDIIKTAYSRKRNYKVENE